MKLPLRDGSDIPRPRSKAFAKSAYPNRSLENCRIPLPPNPTTETSPARSSYPYTSSSWINGTLRPRRWPPSRKTVQYVPASTELLMKSMTDPSCSQAARSKTEAESTSS